MAWLVLLGVVRVVGVVVTVPLTFARSTPERFILVSGAPRIPVVLLKGPVETASVKPDAALVEVSGTVAANVHWIFLPLTLPFTEFTFSVVTVSVPLSRTVGKNLTTPLLFAQT